MLQAEERIDPFRAELPDFSADWRFLLPARPGARLLVLTEDGADFSGQFAGLGVQVVSCRLLVRDANLPRGNGGNIFADLGFEPFTPLEAEPRVPDSFDTVAVPFGIPDALLGPHPWAEKLASLRRLLQPGGTLLLGFSGPRGILRRGPRLGISAAPALLMEALKEAGFARLCLYGAVPNLTRPAYIFPLRKQTLRFFLRHRLMGRRGGSVFRLLVLFPEITSQILPGYFLLAGA